MKFCVGQLRQIAQWVYKWPLFAEAVMSENDIKMSLRDQLDYLASGDFVIIIDFNWEAELVKVLSKVGTGWLRTAYQTPIDIHFV